LIQIKDIVYSLKKIIAHAYKMLWWCELLPGCCYTGSALCIFDV